MKALASLDRGDRRLLLAIALLVAAAVVLIALVRPQQQEDSYIPSTYSTAPHGAKAAYLLLAQLGYREEQSTGPLHAIGDTADAHTVLIIAEPIRIPSQQEIAAVRRVLALGGRVLATGTLAASALPEQNLDRQSAPQLVRGLCEAEPVSFSPLASGGELLMRNVYVLWKLNKPRQRAAFLCAGGGAVVSYAAGKGTVVWWASASPLENQDIASQGALELLLNSLALQPGDRIVWDESLHGAPAVAWNPLRDRIVLALLAQLFGVALLLVLTRGRRSGPLRPLPALVRASPLEFVRSLGGLYRASHANTVPVTIAYERFRTSLAQRWGMAGAQTADAATLASILSDRFGIRSHSLQSDMEACENAGRLTDLTPRQALALVQALDRYRDQVARQAESSTTAASFTTNHRGTIEPQHTSTRGNTPEQRTA